MVPFIVTGDTHGEIGRMVEIMRLMKSFDSVEKYICVTGDFGYLFLNTFEERRILDEIENQDFTIVVVPGNHENYAEINKCEVVDFHGAKAYKLRENIFCIKRGEIFELYGKSFFCMSGGYSIDRYMRIENKSWWKEEMPTDEEYKYAADNLTRYREAGGKIDYIISHTAPLGGLAYLGKNHGEKEYPLNNFLQYVWETVRDELKMHYYGHLHIDAELPALKQKVMWFEYDTIFLDE